MASHAPTALELRLSRELRVSRLRVKRVGGAALLPLGVITTLASKLAYEMRALCCSTVRAARARGALSSADG